MLQPFSQAEVAWRDTLIQKAEGIALDRLGELYGIPRIPVIGRPFWRPVLHAAALGPRDRLGTFFEVLEKIFRPWSDLLTTTCDLRIATPAKLVGGTPNGIAWACTHEHRLVLVEGHGVFWATAVNGADMDLTPVGTTYWQGADWTADEDDVVVRVLPFWLREEGAKVTVYIDAELFSVPATYLQPDAVAARPAGQPIGGALVEDATVRADLPGPLYLTGGGLRGMFQVLLDDLCAAGVLVEMLTFEWCSASGLGIGVLEDLSAYGRVIGATIPSPAAPVGWSP